MTHLAVQASNWLKSPPFSEQTVPVVTIGGSRGGREGRTPPPGRPNSFDFMQFSGKFGVFTPPLEGSRPPLGKILDPPLVTMVMMCLEVA